MLGIQKPQAKDLAPYLKQREWFNHFRIEIKHDINQYFYLMAYISEKPFDFYDDNFKFESSYLFDSKGNEKTFKNRESAFKFCLNIIDNINKCTEAEAEVVCGRVHWQVDKEYK